MVKLHEQGAYLVNGTDLIPDSAEALSAVKSKTGVDTTQAEAAKKIQNITRLSYKNGYVSWE